MPKFTPVLSMAVHHLYIDDTRKYHNGRSHTCNSAVNPSCCIEVRTSFRYKINLAKVLSKPRSHTHFGTIKDGIIMLDKGQGEDKLLDSPNYFLLDSKQDCYIVVNAWELGVRESNIIIL